MTKIIIVGAPRSGTTWVGKVLAASTGTASVHEPDNDLNDSFALTAKARVGRFPLFHPGQLPEKYAQLWEYAIQGGQPENSISARIAQILLRTAKRSTIDAVLDKSTAPVARVYQSLFAHLAKPRTRAAGAATTVCTKSVHSAFAIEAIAETSPESNILIVRRSPFNAVSSWLDLGWKPLGFAQDPDIRKEYIDRHNIQMLDQDASIVSQTAWDYCLLDDAFNRAYKKEHKNWFSITHEELCTDPTEMFKNLCKKIGLKYTEEIENTINESNKSGKGYKTNRVAANQIDRWKTRLTKQQIVDIQKAVDLFKI